MKLKVNVMNESVKIFVVIIIIIINNIKTLNSIRIIKIKHYIYYDKDKYIKKKCYKLRFNLKSK